MKRILFLVALSCAVFSVKAQKFHAPFSLMSVKEAEVTLADGTVLKDMRVKKIKTKKGIAKSIKLSSEQTGKKNFNIDQIKSLSGKPKGLAKLSAASNVSITNAAKTDYGSLGKDAIVYEQVTMPKKSKVKITLLQVLNPEFSSKVKVYADPLMKKSASFAGGLVGGELKSFYIKVGDGPLLYAKKKSGYRNIFKELYASCPGFEAAVLAEFKDINVLDLGKHVLLFEKTCK